MYCHGMLFTNRQNWIRNIGTRTKNHDHDTQSFHFTNFSPRNTRPKCHSTGRLFWLWKQLFSCFLAKAVYECNFLITNGIQSDGRWFVQIYFVRWIWMPEMLELTNVSHLNIRRGNSDRRICQVLASFRLWEKFCEVEKIILPQNVCIVCICICV